MKFQSTNRHLTLLEDYYNHFEEDKRLEKKHGYVEFYINTHFLLKYLKHKKTILDVGAGTGKYSFFLKEHGFEVTAIELMDKHIKIFKSKNKNVPIFKGNALDLSQFKDKSFDAIILFGPLYHLLKEEERIRALKEARRVLKDDGIIFISYLNNEYAILSYGFIKKNIKECIKNNAVDKDFITHPLDDDLYAYLTIKDINKYNKICSLKRIKIIASDGPSNYLRKELNSMDEKTYELFLKYQLKTCTRKDLLGASSHILDIVKKL